MTLSHESKGHQLVVICAYWSIITSNIILMAMPRVSQFSIGAKKRALLVSVVPNPHPFPYSKEPTSYISGDKMKSRAGGRQAIPTAIPAQIPQGVLVGAE